MSQSERERDGGRDREQVEETMCDGLIDETVMEYPPQPILSSENHLGF